VHTRESSLNSRLERDSKTEGAIMISPADDQRIIGAAERKAELIGQPMNIAVACEGGGLLGHVRMHRGRACWLIGACVALFAGSALHAQQLQFRGSVPTGVASPTPLSLTLRDAIDRGLRTNLGLLLSGQASESARGERLRSLSALLPQVTGEVSENVQQIDLKTRGIDFHLPGGFSTPTIVNPFDYMDSRASSITASARPIAPPARTSAPLNCRSRTLAIWWSSPWLTPTCS
jgi:hypothetical protein